MSDSTTLAAPRTAGAPAAPTVRAGWTLGRWLWLIVFVALLCYLPVVLTDRAVFGVRLSNMQLLNLGLSQVNLMLIAMLGALSLNYLTGCAGLISIGHAAFYAVGAMTAAITGSQWGWPFPLVVLAAGATGALAGVHRRPAVAARARPVLRALDLRGALHRGVRLPGVPVQVLRRRRRSVQAGHARPV